MEDTLELIAELSYGTCLSRSTTRRKSDIELQQFDLGEQACSLENGLKHVEITHASLQGLLIYLIFGEEKISCLKNIKIDYIKAFSLFSNEIFSFDQLLLILQRLIKKNMSVEEKYSINIKKEGGKEVLRVYRVCQMFGSKKSNRANSYVYKENFSKKRPRANTYPSSGFNSNINAIVLKDSKKSGIMAKVFGTGINSADLGERKSAVVNFLEAWLTSLLEFVRFNTCYDEEFTSTDWDRKKLLQVLISRESFNNLKDFIKLSLTASDELLALLHRLESIFKATSLRSTTYFVTEEPSTENLTHEIRKKLSIHPTNAFSSIRNFSKVLRQHGSKSNSKRFKPEDAFKSSPDLKELSESLTGSPPDFTENREISPSSLPSSYGSQQQNHKLSFLSKHVRLKRRIGKLKYESPVCVAHFLTLDVHRLLQKVRFVELRNDSVRETSNSYKLVQKKFNFVSWWAIHYILQGDVKMEEPYLISNGASLDSQWKRIWSNSFRVSLDSQGEFDRKVQARVYRLCYMLELAHQLRKVGNFHYFFAVMGALNQPLLDWLWEFVKEKDHTTFCYLNRAVKPDNNYLVHKADLSKFKRRAHVPYLGHTMRYLIPLEDDVPAKGEIEGQELVNVLRLSRRYSHIKSFLEGGMTNFEASNCFNRGLLEKNALGLVRRLHDFDYIPTLEVLVEYSRKEKEVISNSFINKLEGGGFL
eukprot:snap_masked-scaffold_27-processed-gene-4.14-mRNA-1 protein AED:1.00 eAED:1.00 QI:0/-1/0/0/-1/1/1/0/701